MVEANDGREFTMKLKESHIATIISWGTDLIKIELPKGLVQTEDYIPSRTTHHNIDVISEYNVKVGIPTNLTAIPGDANVKLSWKLPSRSTDVIAGYQVEYRQGDKNWIVFANVKSTDMSSVVTGLTNGISYEFQVRAVGNTQVGYPSSVTSATPIAPATVPSAPTGLTATPGNANILLSWTTSPNGGAVITDYIIQYKVKNAISWSTFSDGTNTTTSATVTGLTNGTAYQFRISAVNSAGTSPVSIVASATPTAPLPPPVQPPSVGVSPTPSSVPSAPTGLMATPGNTDVSLSWTAPTNNGGTAISDYIIKYRQKDSIGWLTYPDGTGPSTAATVIDLTNGIQYEFLVMATNLAGAGPASAIESATPVTITTIGVIESTTDGVASVGNPTSMTIKYAVGEFNQYLAEQSSSWRLDISTHNDGTTPAGAVQAIAQLNGAGIKSVIGPASSDALQAVIEYIGEEEMLAISYGSTAPTLAKDDRVFRTVQNDTHTAEDSLYKHGC